MNKLIVMLLLCFSFTLTQSFAMTEHPNDVARFINGSTELKPNQFLRANQFLQSYNRKYKLIYQADGNLVIYLVKGNNLVDIWNSETANTSPGKCIMQGDGNLVIYNANNQSVWSSRTWGHNNQNIFAKLRNDGNFVVKRPNHQLLWESKSGKPQFYGGSVLYGGQILRKGQRMVSNNRKYFLNYQHDGNLVLYKAPNQALWSTKTHRFNTSIVSLFRNGELVVFGNYNHQAKETKKLVKIPEAEINRIKNELKEEPGFENIYPYKVWSSNSGNRYNRNVRLVIENNGRIVIYSENRAIWSKPW